MGLRDTAKLDLKRGPPEKVLDDEVRVADALLTALDEWQLRFWAGVRVGLQGMKLRPEQLSR